MDRQKLIIIGFAAMAVISLITLGLGIAAFVKANKKSTSATSSTLLQSPTTTTTSTVSTPSSLSSSTSPITTTTIPTSSSSVTSTMTMPSTSSATSTTQSPVLNPPRIPLTLNPLFYNITIVPNISALTFDGSVAIDINCSQPTDELWLYASMLEIDLINVILIESSSMQRIPILNRTNVTNQPELSIFKLTQSLTPGMSYRITFTSFKGYIEIGGVGLFDIDGLYAINYTNAGLSQMMFVTFGECCYIRRIFPSFDEPSFKAQFQLTLVVPEKYTVTSNTQPELTNIENRLKTVTFEQTKPMATYLLAFSIFENFVSSSVLSSMNGYNITAWVRSELADQIVETASFEATILDYYSAYFNYTFPYKKLDMILEPFQPYSEEDWGQITYGESVAILNPQMAPNARFTPQIIMAHETAHQWSGDLVTCAWWSDTWLNEGFATFISTIGTRTYTSYSDEVFWLDAQMDAFDADISASTRPLVEPVPNNNQIIMQHFGRITYEKGATMLSMIRWVLGENKFQVAMSEYFQTFAYKSVLTADYLAVMDKYSANTSTLMQSWLYTAGFPVLTATRNGSNFYLEQNPYTNYAQTSNDFIWSIPLWYQTIVNGTAIPNYLLFNVKSMTVEVGPNLVIFNPDVKAMIMVNYDFQTWLDIAQLLMTNHEQLSPLTRAHLIHSAYHLYFVEKVNCTVLWELMQYLGKETEFTVWATILSHDDSLLPASCGFPPETLQNFVNSVYNIVGLSLSYPGHFSDMLSETITEQACKYGNSNCTTAVLMLGEAWFQCIQQSANDFNNCTKQLPPTHRAAIYCELAKNMTEAFMYLESRLCSATYPLTDQDDLVYGLKCTGWQKCPEPSTTSSSATTAAPKPPRIPLTLMPKNYSLTIQPNFTANTFTGQVVITIECRQQTNELWLYAAMLNYSLSDMTLMAMNDSQVIGILSFDVVLEPPELYIYKLDRFLMPNNTYQLSINYQGKIETGGAGLIQNFGIYSIDYINAGQNQTMFISLGECCYERRIYPSFDEPNFKAPTQLTLITPEKYTVTSNTPIIAENIENGLKTTHFASTEPIVTYLVAFAIFEGFTSISAMSNSGVNVTAWARTDIGDMIVDSAKYGALLLDHYTDYFGVFYPYTKMDYILMPNQPFAEELWGQIIFGETDAALNHRLLSPTSAQRPTFVMAHENGHQWSGDLVTCAWWSDIWLNEGFANFIETIGIRALPDYANYSDEVLWTDSQLVALAIDSHESVHPVVVPLINNNDVIMQGSFNPTIYDKGANILSMVRWILGEDEFKMALHEYFATYAYQSAATDDFLNLLERYQPQLKQHLTNWLYEAGLPLVEVTRLDRDMVQLRQSRFTLENVSNSTVCDNFTTISNVSDMPIWMTGQWMNLSIASNCAIVVNPDARAMIRVNYDTAMWKEFAKILQTNPKILNTMTRTYLVEEAYWMAVSGRLDCTTHGDIVSYFSHETEATPWNTLIKMLGSSRLYPRPCNYTLPGVNPALVAPIYDQIGWNVMPPFETHFPNLLIELITKTACQEAVGNCTGIAANEGIAWLNCMQTNRDNFTQCSDGIAPVHRPAVYCALARNSTSAFDYLQARLCKIPHPTVDSYDLEFGLECAGWTECPKSENGANFYKTKRDLAGNRKMYGERKRAKNEY